MLVVTLERHGSVLIGPDIEVRIVSVDRDTVRLAINAPKTVRINRVRTAKPAPFVEPESEMEETLRLVREAAH